MLCFCYVLIAARTRMLGLITQDLIHLAVLSILIYCSRNFFVTY